MMKIKLIRTGGFIPITKVAEAEADFTDQELIRLIEVIKPDPSAPRIKDGNNYQLNIGTKNTPVDLEKVPEEYRELFDKLKSELKIIK
jgi:hypothetical protein